VAVCWASIAAAEDKKKEEKKKEPPQIIMANPLAVSPGKKAPLTLRGLKLDNVTSITLGEGERAIKAELKNKGAAKPPDRYEAAKVGDTQAAIEFTLPADFAPGSVKIVAANADGESKPYELQVIAADMLVQEKEPNDSFKGAQPIAAGVTLSGVVAGNNQVDVFAYTGKAGEKVTIEVLAARLGSALDASITLFDPSRNIVTMADDRNGSRDPVLSLTLPSDGVFLIVLQDALDRGEQTHPFLLRVTQAK
jgi:hypothetical protein